MSAELEACMLQGGWWPSRLQPGRASGVEQVEQHCLPCLPSPLPWLLAYCSNPPPTRHCLAPRGPDV